MRRALLVFFLTSPFFAQDLPHPILQPTPPTEAETRSIKEGIALHDAGQFSDAIKKYQEVLHQNSNNVIAMHELAFTCYMAKNYDCAMQTSLAGAQYQSDDLAYFYMTIANIYDDNQEGVKADKVYRFAIEQAPNDSLLHFNYGVNLVRESQLPEARKQLETALRLNPNHPASHFTLGRAYELSGYRVPAILAYSRFLALEPSSPRSAAAVKSLQPLLVHDVSTGKKTASINITLNPNAPNDEGDFTSAELAIAIGVAAATTEKEKDKSPFDHLANTYQVLAEILGRTKGGFAAEFYGPFFKRLEDRKLTEAFVAYAWRSANLQGSEDWSAKNADKITEFQNCCVKN